MKTLFLLLLGIFAGVAAMAFLVERFAKPMEPDQQHKIARWIIPLAALAIVLQMLNYYFN